MLTSMSLRRHMAANTPGEAAYPWDGKPTGMAADTLAKSTLTVQQNVPNIGDVATAPKTKVNPTYEQGEGRAPGWRNGWMKKAIPLNFAFGSHGQPHLGAHPRAEGNLASGPHAPGQGGGQSPYLVQKGRRAVLENPETVYLTAAVPPLQTWGEPL